MAPFERSPSRSPFAAFCLVPRLPSLDSAFLKLLCFVIGTYVNSEQTRWTAEGRSGPPPVWTVKADTDAAYFSGVGLILNAIKQNVQEASPSACSSSSGDCAVVFATHSAETVDHVCTELAKLGLAKADGSGALVGSLDVGKRVAFAQICGTLSPNSSATLVSITNSASIRGLTPVYTFPSMTGMKDALTNEIAGRLRFEQTLPSAIKVRRRTLPSSLSPRDG